MKFKVEHEGDVYAVAIATGTSTDGRKYANVLLKKKQFQLFARITLYSSILTIKHL